jgi:hypothetical protein
MTSALTLSAILALCGPACPEPSAAPALIALPAELVLADLEPGSTVRPAVWLVNRGEEPLSLRAARGSCGCTAVDFKPATLGPRAALEVPLVIRAPSREGESKTVQVTFAIEGAAPLTLPVRIETRGAASPLLADLAADPPGLDLGTVVAGSTMTTSARLVNHGDLPRTVKAAHASCSCMRTVDFAPFVLEPGEAADIHLQVDVPATAGRTVKELTVLVERGSPVRVPLALTSAHPAMDAAQRELARTLGDGVACEALEIRGATVTAVAWDRERTAPQGLLTCTLDAAGAIASVRYDEIHPAPRTAG